jgi:hypothetical protein
MPQALLWVPNGPPLTSQVQNQWLEPYSLERTKSVSVVQLARLQYLQFTSILVFKLSTISVVSLTLEIADRCASYRANMKVIRERP